MFYDIYEELCRLKGEAPSRAAEHMGLNRATVTFWKKESFCPRQATLSTVAGLAIVLLMVVSLLSELFTSVRSIFQLY